MKSRRKRTGRPRMILRFDDPRDDRTGGEDHEEDFEQSSPCANNTNGASNLRNSKEQKHR